MRRHSAALAVVVGLLVGGCGFAVSGQAAPPVVADASGVDMCTILTDAELSGLGVDLGSRRQFDELGLVGCQWVGKPITLRLERDEDPVAVYRARRDDLVFTRFVDNTVNGRAGVQLSVERDRSDCAQLMDGGPVSLTVAVAVAFSVDPPKIDSCAEALRIAQLIEPRLPKAGT
ncbi:MAG: DUF3558 family protein [Pseudonocardiaceae bacterium]